jgi:hypothetical protein
MSGFSFFFRRFCIDHSMSDAARILTAIVITALLVAGGCWWWFARRRACDPSPPVGAPSCTPNLNLWTFVLRAYILPLIVAGGFAEQRINAEGLDTRLESLDDLSDKIQAIVDWVNVPEDEDTARQRLASLLYLGVRDAYFEYAEYVETNTSTHSVETLASAWSQMIERYDSDNVPTYFWGAVYILLLYPEDAGSHEATSDPVADQLNVMVRQETITEEDIRSWLDTVVASLDWCFFNSLDEESNAEFPVTHAFFHVMQMAPYLLLEMTNTDPSVDL